MGADFHILFVDIASHTAAVADSVLAGLYQLYAAGASNGLDVGTLLVGGAAGGAVGGGSVVGGGSGTPGGGDLPRDDRDERERTRDVVENRRRRLDNPTPGDRVGTVIFNGDRWLKDTVGQVWGVSEPAYEEFGPGAGGITRN